MSQFLNDTSHYQSGQPTEIDFSDVLKLHGGGSICDIYRTKWQRREVFVKRLKEEYRSNPLYLDALDKEFEIGVRLKHPSLPNYLEFHRDYIIIEYIDGCTLEEMIKRKDPWLSNENNIVKMLSQLIMAVDYLHFHHITHCDIKTDNILITANNHDLVLIDFDKSYTDSLNDTSGDPTKYGLSSDDVGKMAIDFHGISQVVKKLKDNVPDFRFRQYKDFINECHKPQPSSEELLKLLDKNRNKRDRKIYWMVMFAPFCVALVFGAVLLLLQGKNGYESNYDDIDNTPELNKDTATLVLSPSTSPSLSQEEIHDEAKKRAILLDKRIQPYFDELNFSLNKLEKFGQDPGITGQQLLDSMRKFSNKEDEYCHEAFEILRESNPGLSEREEWRVMAYSKAYTGYKRKSTPILKELGKKVEELSVNNK